MIAVESICSDTVLWRDLVSISMSTTLKTSRIDLMPFLNVPCSSAKRSKYKRKTGMRLSKSDALQPKCLAVKCDFAACLSKSFAKLFAVFLRWLGHCQS